jgi:predicted permease
MGWVGALVEDLRHAVRIVTKSPGFSVAIIVTLALGIGVTTAIFSVVYGVLLKPLPFDDPDDLVAVTHRAPGWVRGDFPVALSQFATYQAEKRVFDDIGLWSVPVATTLVDDGGAERVLQMSVSWELLALLGVEPVLGRRFIEADDIPGEAATIMLTHGYWHSRFGGDRGVLGTTLRLDARIRTVIGVLPPTFDMPGQDPNVVIPTQMNRGGRFRGYSYFAIGRLSPGVSVADASTDINRMIPMATERFGGTPVNELEAAGFQAHVRPLQQEYVGDIGGTLWILMGSVLIILMIAWANAANLVLVRTEARQREVALRSAIGANRGQLFRHFLLENLTLAVLGGFVGIGLAAAGVRVFLLIAPENIPRLNGIAVDVPVVGAAFVIAVVTGLLLTSFPALRARSLDVMAALKEGGRGGSSVRHRTRRVLVVAQVAMALMLLVGSGLMLRSYQALHDVDPGVREPDGVVTFRVNIPEAEVRESASVAQTLEEVAERLAGIPGVESVGAASSLPMEGFHDDDAVQIEGKPLNPVEEIPQQRFQWVTGGHMETIRIPLLAGRVINWSDVRAGATVVVVTRRFAVAHWGDPKSAIGRRIAQGALESRALKGGSGGAIRWHEIVGVVQDVHDDGLDQPAPEVIFWPVPNSGYRVHRDISFAVRTGRSSPLSVIPEIRRVIAGVSPNFPVSNAGTLSQILARSMARTSFTLLTLLVAGCVALMLGLVGIYGVMSYIVSERRRELGVRIALGARPRDVGLMVVRQAAILAVSGVAIGSAAAVGATRFMTSLLYGVKATDPLTFAGVASLLMFATMAASYLPARRAASTDPLVTLRSE